MLETRSTINKLVLLAVLVAVGLATTGLTIPPALAGLSHAVDWPCCGATTERVSLEEGQTTKLELRNQGDEPVRARLQFVDKEGKVVVQRETTVKPGGSGALTYGGFSGGVRIELQAQFGTQAKTSIGLLRPALRILDANGKTIRLIGPEGFSVITFQGSTPSGR